MEDVFLSLPISDNKNICISPVTASDLGASTNLGGDYGLFLYETLANDPLAGVEILAKFATQEAAAKVAELLGIASGAKRLNRPAEFGDGESLVERAYRDLVGA